MISSTQFVTFSFSKDREPPTSRRLVRALNNQSRSSIRVDRVISNTRACFIAVVVEHGNLRFADVEVPAVGPQVDDRVALAPAEKTELIAVSPVPSNYLPRTRWGTDTEERKNGPKEFHEDGEATESQPPD